MAYFNGKKILNAPVTVVEVNGYDEGYAQGKEVERIAFWEQFQNQGKREYYNYAFYGSFAWKDNIYDPMYPIVTKNGNAVFQQSGITDTRVPVDLSGCVTGTATSTFDGCSNLKTIFKLIVPAGLKYANVFRGCTALENITFEGEIGNSISFADSPKLSYTSLLNIIEHLATVSTTQTLNIGTGNIGKLMASEIAVATQKGWSVV